MRSPFAEINTAQMRAEAADRHHALRHIFAAACLAAAGLMLAHMGLSTLRALPDHAAQAVALRGM